MSSENKRDYYDVLGINKSATKDEIKRAFRKYAKKYHPDMNPGDKDAEEKFKEANEAYSMLSDQETRERYDRFGFAGVDPSHGFGGGGGVEFDFGDIFGGGGFGDIFGDFFGGGRRSGSRRRRAPRRGTDLEMRANLKFEEAVFGIEKHLSIKRRVPCHECNGSGAEPGTSPVQCSTCGGQGQVAQTRRTAFGIMQQITTCPNCSGSGQIIKKKCKECKGTGIVTDMDKVKIKIPPGIPDEGAVIQMPGKGNIETKGSIPGDLTLYLHVKPHKYFTRDGKHLLRDIHLDYLQLLFGDKNVPIMTLEGELVSIDIPPGTQPRTPFLIKGKGVPIYKDHKNRRGDLFITVYCEIPDVKQMAKEERESYQDLQTRRLEKIRQEQFNKEDSIKKESIKDKKNKKEKEK